MDKSKDKMISESQYKAVPTMIANHTVSPGNLLNGNDLNVPLQVLNKPVDVN